MNQQPEIVLVGDYEFEEFRFAFESTCETLNFGSVEGLLRSDMQPDLIVLCQKNRHSFSPDVGDSISAKFPLAGKLVLLGSYCEGETRSGLPVREWYRRFWYQWQYFYVSFLQNWGGNLGNDANLPGTTNHSDRLLQMAESREVDTRLKRIPAGFQVGLMARWNQEYEWIQDLLATSQANLHRVIGGDWNGPLDCLLIIADSADEWVQEAIRKATTQSVRSVVVCNFPRLDEFKRCLELGCSRVVAKPFLNAELVHAIWPQ